MNIISLLIPFAFGIVIFGLFLFFNNYFGKTYLVYGTMPNSSKLNEILRDIDSLDIESRIKIIQRVIGNKVHIGLTITKHQILIDYARDEGIDPETILQNDNSIG